MEIPKERLEELHAYRHDHREADRTALSEHLADNGGVLLHPLVARMRDLAIDAYERGGESLSTRLVAAFDAGLRDGADSVQNAVSVSFVEGTPGRGPSHHSLWPT